MCLSNHTRLILLFAKNSARFISSLNSNRFFVEQVIVHVFAWHCDWINSMCVFVCMWNRFCCYVSVLFFVMCWCLDLFFGLNWLKQRFVVKDKSKQLNFFLHSKNTIHSFHSLYHVSLSYFLSYMVLGKENPFVIWEKSPNWRY